MFRRGGILSIVVLALAACNSAPPATTAPPASGSPAPSAAAVAPSPSSTPADVSALFLPQIAAATSAKMEITGTLNVGSQIGALSGSLTYVGGDSDQTLTTALGGTPSTTYSIHAIGVGYTKTNDGPWLKDVKAPASGHDLSTVLKGVTGLVDKGVETKNGESLHRLELPAGTVIDPAAFGLTGAGMTNTKVGLIFYAADDGKPVYLSVTASWTQSGTAVSMTIDFRFVQIGGALSVVAPDHVWSRFTSKRFHYRIAYPDDWDAVATVKGVDYLNSPGAPFVGGTRYSVLGFSLNVVVKDNIAYDKAHDKFTLNSNESFTLAGAKARLVTFHATVSGKKVVIYEVFAIKSGYVYDLFWSSPKGHEATDKTMFKEMLSTFAFN